MYGGENKKMPPARRAAYIALTCALLTGGQYAFSFVVGVEIVTLILAGFSYAFGARSGALCALAFSLLRCIIFPFSPSALILYVIYYPAFAATFGALGHIRDSAFEGFPAGIAATVNAALAAICIGCGLCCGLDLIKASELYRATIHIMLWTVFGLCAGGLTVFDVLLIMNRLKKNAAAPLKIIFLTAVAAVFTICFTLLDDIITPLLYGYSRMTALAYFYASFTAMLPQTVCTIVTVSTLLPPVSEAFKRVARLH